jgi:Big-like domain-containing protein
MLLSLLSQDTMFSARHWRRSPRVRLSAVAILALFFLTGISAAQLARVGPVDRNNGFPQWYQDSTGLAVNACLPNAQELADGTCLVTADMLTNPAAPIAFPNNFPDEFFFYALDTGGPVNGGRLVWRARLEGAFANGPVIQGDQMVFARVRVVMDVPEPGGTYTVTHPYGVEVFPDVQPGVRAIFFTNDVGLVAGNFSDALGGQITNFIRPSAVGPGGPPDPFVVLPGGNTFLADPAALVFVTGSPFPDPLNPAQFTNYVRVDGPNIGGPGIDTITFDQFNIAGQVHLQPIPSPVDVERSTYRRDASGNSAQLDLFATAHPSIGAPQPILSVTGTGILGTLMSNQGSRYFAQPVFRGNTPVTVPSSVTITNSSDTPTSFTEANVVDQVEIDTANYDPATQTLTIQARSSDLWGNPQLVALPWGALDSSSHELDVPGVTVPPADVTVQSAFGGRATRMVTVAARVVNAADPFADNDAIAQDLPADTTSTINVLANDLADGQAGSTNCTAATCAVTILANPTHGTVSIDANQNANYAPALAYSGPDSFSYTFTSGGKTSNVALVSFNVAFVNHAPIAGPDSATAGLNAAININVLANDSDPDAGDFVNPASVTIVTPPLSGTATVNPDGSIHFVPGASGNITLQYTVADSHGLASAPATVTITVTNPDLITIIQAQFRTSKRDWRIRGTDTIAGPGNTITIHIGPTLAGPVLGTIAVDAAGGWDFVQKGSSRSPDATNTVSVESTKGGVRLAIPLQITN